MVSLGVVLCVTAMAVLFAVPTGGQGRPRQRAGDGKVPLRAIDPAFRPLAGARWRFGGPLGGRIARNAEHWILRAPDANPGMLEMLRRRNRHVPHAEHTPWAGEFAGKYLISAVQACRMVDDARLTKQVEAFVANLIGAQGEDGYLGPWPTRRQLMGDCDLWGHYHCMLGLLMWHDHRPGTASGRKALEAVLKAAEGICRLYVDSGRRPIEAGNPCFNMSVIHIMAELYRRTGNERWLAMVRRIEEDMPKDGDWLNKGVQGVPYWMLPGTGPRWEALHILQGFATLYEATGDERYRKAVLNHWNSIRELDRHPSGAFSTNEQASGTVFLQGSIETCCSVAWMALTADVLRLTGDSSVADELELTLWNQALAAQHPSGSWCTYDTPLNGVRVPSYHQISFQYRPGSPELNCCSVNSPRTLGMLSEWAVMSRDDGLVINFYGPCEVTVPLGGGRSIHLRQTTDYPVDGRVRIAVEGDGAERTIHLRIPAWSAKTRVRVNGKPWQREAQSGRYLGIRRAWVKGDVIELTLDLSTRLMLGDGPDRGGRLAIHRGPLLLAFDAGQNEIELAALKPFDARKLTLKPLPAAQLRGREVIGAWLADTDGGPAVVLCDFASAGWRGTEYASWLPVSNAPPPPPRLEVPADAFEGKPGPVLFRWSSSGAPDERYDLVVARDAAFGNVVLRETNLPSPYVTARGGLLEAGEYYWKVVARNASGETMNRGGPGRFVVRAEAREAFLTVREDGCMAASSLDGSGEPNWGELSHASGVSPAADRAGNERGAVNLTGEGSGLRYRIPFFPETEYSFAGWVRPNLGQSGMRQVFSAWCRAGDDPLRVTIEGSEVSARIEASHLYRTPNFALTAGVWTHIAAVKQGTVLRLYVNGEKAGEVNAPKFVLSQSRAVGVGFNPLLPAGECLSGDLDEFAFYARALTEEEIRKAARR